MRDTASAGNKEITFMKTNTEMLTSIDDETLDDVAGGQLGGLLGGIGPLTLGLGVGSLLSANVSADVSDGVNASASVTVLGIPINLNLGAKLGILG
jgi:hypothetical protein